ncbi:MAG: hypothetical protein AVDCRST_MAG37-1427 [uncultured Rubrobacteraceae bacterium]|uniref:Uncharacterized protein n=1 Tax=uncultured Rubrobacteraceae bacterium TaxID=349277 RepID=A0A6J4QMM3_9ACTN|nr:MAG: hypothetical protein AVDCRST_MAG37-1427 [uncultured Rubrobacteraceae bacterium]
MFDANVTALLAGLIERSTATLFQRRRFLREVQTLVSGSIVRRVQALRLHTKEDERY